MISYFARGHKLMSDSLGLDTIETIDDINERLYAEDPIREYRVPVTLERRGVMTIKASCRESAEGVARVLAGLDDDSLQDVQTSERIGAAVEA